MKQTHKARRRGSPGRRQEPPADGLRDPDIVHAHQITRRDRRSGASRVRSGAHHPTAPAPSR
jgi:hypothetical protein